jgi:glutathione synthase/RimK-type ligase-like ATP-grasp enzyme
MRFAMLARNPGLYSHVRLCEAARARGHSIDVVNTLHVHMNITSNQPLLRYNGRRLPIYDAVIPRIGASITHYGLAVLRQFEMQGVYPLNESVAKASDFPLLLSRTDRARPRTSSRRSAVFRWWSSCSRARRAWA